MHLSNDFSKKDREIWFYNQQCALCNSNQGVTLHHIYGRASNSILNSIPLCHDHHKNADCHNTSEQGNEHRIKYLSIALRQVIKSWHVFTKNDTDFLEMVKRDFMKAKELL